MSKEQQFRDESGRGTSTVGSIETTREQTKKAENLRGGSEAENKAAAERIAEELQINELLAAADEAIATPSPRSPEEIDEKAAALESLEKRLERLHDISESRVKRLERIEKRGMPGMSASDYEELERNNVNAELLKRHKEVQEKLSVMNAQKEKRSDDAFHEVMGRLAEAESRIREAIESAVSAAATERWNKRIAKARDTMDKHYEARAVELEGLITELKADPEVAKRHQERINELKERVEKEELKAHQAFLEEITLKIDLLSQQQNAVLKRVEQIAGASAIVADMTTKEITGTRQTLITAILEGKGDKQINDPSEVIPWKRMDTERYYDSLNSLLNPNMRASLKKLADAGDQNAITTSERLGAVTKTHDRFKDIANGEFWAAFNKRAQSDKAEAARRLEEARKRHEVQKEKIEAEIRAVIERGGFRVEVPGDAMREAGKAGGGGVGAVRLEVRRAEEKKNIYLEIVEVAGAAVGVLRKGSTSKASGGITVDAPQFPQWLRTSIFYNEELAAKLEELEKERWSRKAA